MIVFNLICADRHSFEGWFASSAEFEKQKASGMLSCPECGLSDVTKALHAPYVNTGAPGGSSLRRARDMASERASASGHGSGMHDAPEAHGRAPARQYANLEDSLARVVDYVVANTEDVGDAFPEEARKIYYRETSERKIRGSASFEEAQELREEGIDVVALPLAARRLSKAH